MQETPLQGCRCEECKNFGRSRQSLIGLGIRAFPLIILQHWKKRGASLEKKKAMIWTSATRKFVMNSHRGSALSESAEIAA